MAWIYQNLCSHSLVGGHLDYSQLFDILYNVVDIYFQVFMTCAFLPRSGTAGFYVQYMYKYIRNSKLIQCYILFALV